MFLLENSHKLHLNDNIPLIPINIGHGILYSGGIKVKKISKLLAGIAILSIMSFSVPVTQSTASAAAPIENVDLPFEH